MPWFYCDDCGDSIKKPKVTAHYNQCRASSFTCIDCSRQFDRTTVHAHTSCVTEHEKYAQGATKPGGYASKGYYNDTGAGAAADTTSNDLTLQGLEFLSTRPPWVCSICNVTCTSQDTLMGHASGAKHKRRAKAAIAARDGGGEGAAEGGATTTNGTTPPATTTPENGVHTNDRGEKNGKEKVEKQTKQRKLLKKDTIKWKKLAKDELKRKSNKKTGMEVNLLLETIIERAGAGGVNADAVLQFLQNSSKFIIEGDTINLRQREVTPLTR